MSQKISALLCTRDLVIFPESVVSIDVGRQMSIRAIEAANQKYGGEIIVVSQKNHLIDQPKEDDLYKVATKCKIKTLRRKGNAVKLIVEGVERVEILSYLENKSHFEVEYRELEFNLTTEVERDVLVNKIYNEIVQINPKTIDEIGFRKISQLDNLFEFYYTVAQFYIFKVSDKQELLEILDEDIFLNKLLEKIMYLSTMEKLDHEIDVKIKERFDENQKEYILREKVRLIKEELNDDSNSDVEKIGKDFENNPYPEHIKKRVKEEIRRYEMTPASSAESAVIRNYLEWIHKIPWYQKSIDNQDLNEAAKILDEDHYGLIKVKERILEYLAVKKMTNSLKSPILCLVGPPGVGKTSLAKSIAKSLNREFIKQSLGGVKDESEIRGHRRTYLGSMPGRIIQGMKKAGTINPVFLIDEIDKMANDFRGDPSSAMLEVLDPEQNYMFSDNYVEEPYDLSDVLFVATANYIENIPPALKDRLEIVELSSYTELEKLKIANTHLIPKQIKNNGLNNKQIKFSDDVILHIIRHYTRESGVRNLDRVISTICRKVVLKILKENKKSIKINLKNLKDFIGQTRFEYSDVNHKDQVGVVTGLAYTAYGGDTLPIEVTYFKGKGKFIVTGQLGEVMKESAEIALDWIKSNSDNLKIDIDWFSNNDIHIHVPEGAVPKDGPSAGITITSALVSSILNKKAKGSIAMTGEVTLRGNVLAIGGLKEKSLAAHRVGIKTIIFPKDNVKDLENIPSEVKESIKFIPVSHVSEVLKEIIL